MKDRTSLRSLAALVGVALVLVPALAWADEGAARSDALPTSFAPLFAISIAIERFWETFFTLIENSVIAGGAMIRSLSEPLKKLETGVERAQRAVDEAHEALTGAHASGAESAALTREFLRAQAVLDDARARVMGITSNPVYVSLKRTVILCGSFVIGPVIAFAGHLTLFRSIGFARMPEVLDMALTGIIVGSGSEPMHGILSSLGSLNSALGGIGELARRRPMVDSVTVASGRSDAPRATSDGAPAPNTVQVVTTTSEHR